ncbi:G-protein coupled receptor 55-like [Vidua macroura]|nr:G-protein coupled receptor 55-like [Vidua chalybeata]XP_053841808.1 G-protein coupled receptor 55-like [Vidua macroura]
MTNSSENCSFTAINSLAWSVQLGLSIPTFILGLVLNSLALFVFCCFWRKQTKTSVYMISLVLADILLLLSLPPKLYYSVTTVPGLLCSFIQAPYFVNTYTSIFIIVCITVDRYICIRHPFEGRANQSPRWAVVICCFIWAAAWICSIPIYVFQKKEPIKCFHNMSDQTWSVPFIVSVEIFGFLIPLAMMVFCSAQTIWILLNHKTHDKKNVEESGSLRVIVINLVVFLVCFTPVHLGILLQCLVRQHVIVSCRMKQTISLFLQVSMTFANLNCCLDAIFYYFAAKEFCKKTHLKRVIELCPVFSPCAIRWHCQQWENAPCQDTDSVVPDVAGTLP